MSYTEIVFGLSNNSDLSELLPLLAWLYYARKKPPYHILGWFFAVSAPIKIYTLITAEMHKNNMPAYHLLSCIEIIAVTLFYNKLIYGRVIYWLIALLLIFNIANTLFYQSIHDFNSLAWAIDMMVIIGLGMFYFYKLYQNDTDHTPLEKRPDFMVTVAWLLYAAGSLFAYLMGTEILSGKAEGFFKNAWIFQEVSNIIKNIIMVYAFSLVNRHE